MGRLDHALKGVAGPDKQEIVCEIRAHILDSIANSADRTGAIDRVLRLLGSPESLAQRYNAECLLTRAERSFSPVLLLRTSWRWAKLGIKGTVAFFIGFMGYTMALALTVSVLMKPFVPGVGLWLGPHSLSIGTAADHQGMHELLGDWFVPVIVAAAFGIGVATTQALRWLIQRRVNEPRY